MPRGKFTVTKWPIKPCVNCSENFQPRTGRNTHCSKQVCRAAWKQDWRDRNKQYISEQNKQYRRDRPQQYQEAGIRRNVQLWASPEDVDLIMQMWRDRLPKCEICGVSEEVHGKALAIDHNHFDSKFRGFLCSKCNSAIGFFQEDLNILRSAVKYLERYEH